MDEPREPIGEGGPLYTVSDLLRGLRVLLEERVGRLWVVGEVAELYRAASGHLYFTLQDEGGRIRAAMFRSSARALAFDPEDGLEVLAYAEVSVYEARGDLQLVVRCLEPRGQGALQLAFEQLRRKLEAEGLFDPARKRPLPTSPAGLGVVTSLGSAALRDVLQVTARRFPSKRILIAPARVQGEAAEREIAAALDALGARPEVDVILLVRGGGSLEDLRPFNSEAVARAIARAPVPVLCGVGHEVDVTIADLTADVRAPTPSAAAELAVHDRAEARGALAREWRRLQRALRTLLENRAGRLGRERDALFVLAPSARLAAQGARWRAAARGLVGATAVRLERARGRLGELSARLDTLSPLGVLSRGYALVRRTRDGAIVREARQVASGERLAIRVARAELEASVESARPVPEPAGDAKPL